MHYYIFYTLLKKEVWRFAKVYHQTIFSPVINALLMMAIFALAIGNRIETSYSISFMSFLASGLIIMSAIQNAFANSSSTFVMGKVLGHVIDYLIPPLSNLEILLAIVLSSILRATAVAIVAIITISLFYPLSIHSITFVIFFLFLGAMFLATLGVLCGIFSNSFDQMSAITSYIITPMTFLSGTFYSIKDLPEFWQNVAIFNPFFHIIDGFRYGITGHHDSGSVALGALFMAVINIILLLTTFFLLNKKIRNN
jgi:ABC-2 type transport system permease protein